MKKYRVSVVIPTYNRKESLRRCLLAVTAQDFPSFEIVVVDDGSTDGTGNTVQREFPQVRYVRQQYNRGSAAARNLGIKATEGEIVVFTDDDCIPSPDWISSHVKNYDDPQVGCVGGLQLSTHPNLYQHFHLSQNWDVYTEFRRFSGTGTVRGFGTNNLSVRSEVFDQAGYFDEAFLSGADPELAHRVALAGYSLIRDPALAVAHSKVDSLGTFLRTRFRRGCGSVLFDVKYGTLSVRRFLPLVDPGTVRRTWTRFVAIRADDYTPCDLCSFLLLVVLTRVADVTGRAYYHWKIGRNYLPSASALVTDQGGSSE